MRLRTLGAVARVIVLVLVGLLSLAASVSDGVVRHEVESRIAAMLAKEVRAKTPTVRMGGGLALLQLGQRRLDDVVVTSPQVIVSARSTTVTLVDVRAHAQGVSPITEPAKAKAQLLTMTGTVPWTEVRRLLNRNCRYAEGNRIQCTQVQQFMGRQVPVTYSAKVSVEAERLELTQAVGDALGLTLPQSIVNQITAEILNKSVLPKLPHLAMTELTSTPKGLEFTYLGANVPLSAF